VRKKNRCSDKLFLIILVGIVAVGVVVVPSSRVEEEEWVLVHPVLVNCKYN